MNKSPDAFRTISEVADLLETPAHVLRFWESRFPQIKPVKRAGGRRYYRPADVALLTGIKRLLHEDGMTIRGVQKILREQGVRHVSGVDEVAEGDDDAALAAALAAATGTPEPDAPLPLDEVETAQIIALQAALRPPVQESVETVAEQEDEQDTERGDLQVDWQSDTLAEDDALADLPDPLPPGGYSDESPDDLRPDVAVPPAPVTSAPVVADLFARQAPTMAPPPPEPVSEAPMAVWADESDLPPDTADTDHAPPPAPTLKITRIGAATPPPPVAEQPVALSGPTLAQRLRARSADTLTTAERQQLAEIRERAVALHNRMTGPSRVQG
ncbi:MAG: MerR family transcriptional regulator [Pseudotabrizicola sp.]|uniref:MerR family transcriptional regulator n=1 Tax=Pseudotabrizicola sp. TaxID=2939647 RepID=UPI00273152F6|nr:MerR family transcriptional regulator [Pseudotabrizicola sp.]MDP2082716.1 MerR family transcriptional regulator [Pseudotabrizicola sp.]MDZ7576311.1 MerR family transcriptional regulator [Pseudotabrizicola sp.]